MSRRVSVTPRTILIDTGSQIFRITERITLATFRICQRDERVVEMRKELQHSVDSGKDPRRKFGENNGFVLIRF